MRYFNAAEKQHFDEQLEMRELLLAKARERLQAYEATEHHGPPQPVETSFGSAVIMEGDFLLRGPTTVIVPKHVLDDREMWVPVGDDG